MVIVYAVLLIGLVLFCFQWALKAMRRSPDAEARAAVARFDAAVADLRKALARLMRSVLHNS